MKSKFVAVLILSLGTSFMAYAGPDEDRHEDKDNHKWTVQAPEIDPGSAMSGLMLLAGGLAVLRGRSLKKK